MYKSIYGFSGYASKVAFFKNGEDPSLRGKILDFFKSDCKDGDYCHIQAIEEWPAFNDVKTDNSNKNHQQNKQNWFPHPELILQY